MSKKLKIGVVGCGGIARFAHFPAYANMDNVEIVAVCDIIKERAEQMKKDFHLDSAKVYGDFEEFIQDENIESVDICTPNYLHAPFAVASFAHGKHVFCEKPDAVGVDKVNEMKAAAEKAGKTLMVMRNNRFAAASQYTKQYIEDGKMGDIYSGRCGWQRRRGIPGKGGWFTTKEQSGGGPLIDLGVHMIDLAIWLMGNPTPVAVSGSTYCKFADATSVSDSANSNFGDSVEDGTFDVEDLAMGFIKFDNGACLQIEFSWASNVEREHKFVELRGTKAGCFWHDDRVKIFGEEHGTLFDLAPHTPDAASGHEKNLRHYVDVILNGAKPCFEPQQGVNMIKILSAIYESAQTGKEVSLVD